MPFDVHVRGRILRITSWHESPRHEKWLDGWFESQFERKWRSLVARRLSHYCENGLPRNNKHKYRHIEGKLCEIKPTGQIRLLGGELQNEFCIVHALIKKEDALRRSDIDKAKEWLEKCYEERTG